MNFKIFPTLARAITLTGKWGRMAGYGINTLSAHHIDQHVKKPDSVIENGLQLISPSHYIAYKIAKQVNAGPLGYVLATVLPERYAAYQLAKKSGGSLNIAELAGVMFAPTVTVAFHAGKDQLFKALGKVKGENKDQGDTFEYATT